MKRTHRAISLCLLLALVLTAFGIFTSLAAGATAADEDVEYGTKLYDMDAITSNKISVSNGTSGPNVVRDENGQPVMETVYYLSDGDGRFVMGEDGNMIEVSDPSARYNVGIFDYARYDGMEHTDGTRFIAQDKNGGLFVGSGELVQFKLENSNVDLAEEMTKLIEIQRAYTMALRMMTTSDEIESTINSLGN